MKTRRISSETNWGIILLATLLVTTFVLPSIRTDWQAALSRVFYSILYLSALFTLERRRKTVVSLAVVALVMEWISGSFDLVLLNSVSKALNSVFFLLVVIFLIKQVATAKHVDLKVILGSVLGYLLLGLIFSIVVNYIMVRDPAAFNVTQLKAGEVAPVSRLSEAVYFTFVSLATLGYGDILPLKPYTRSLAIFITVAGQLYIAVIIALLVGKFAAEPKEAE